MSSSIRICEECKTDLLKKPRGYISSENNIYLLCHKCHEKQHLDYEHLLKYVRCYECEECPCYKKFKEDENSDSYERYKDLYDEIIKNTQMYATKKK